MSRRTPSYIEGFLYSQMVGLGETFLVGFALSLGLSASLSSMINTLPIFVGSLLQFGFLYLLKGSSPRQSLIFLTLMQALCLGVMAIPVFFQFEHRLGHLFLVGMISLYWGFGFTAGPIWNRFVVRLYGKEDLRHFFFRRNAICHISSVIALTIAAFVLGDNRASSPESTQLLAKLIFAAALARCMSSLMFQFHRSDEFEETATVRGMDKGSWRFLLVPKVRPTIILLFLTNFSVYIAAPYFAAYKLSELNLNFVQFNFLIGASFAARILASYFLNGLIKRLGVRILLFIGVVGIAPLPALWILSHHFWWLFLLQVLSGIAWSCHELGLTLVLIENIEEKARSQLLTWANLTNTIAMLLGVGISLTLINKPMTEGDYHKLFMVSSVLRFVPLLILHKIVIVPSSQVIFRFLSLLTGGRGITRPVLIPKKYRSG